MKHWFLVNMCNEVKSDESNSNGDSNRKRVGVECRFHGRYFGVVVVGDAILVMMFASNFRDLIVVPVPQAKALGRNTTSSNLAPLLMEFANTRKAPALRSATPRIPNTAKIVLFILG